MKTDERVEAYIAQAAPFAQPILRHLRRLVHEACPGVEETIKWSMPHFTLGGTILCSMAAFKSHCGFGFWRPEMARVAGAHAGGEGKAMGNLGRLASVADLPADAVLLKLLRQAARLAHPDRRPPSPSLPKRAAVPLPVPDDLAQALAAKPAAYRVFNDFSPSARNEYVSWILGAKRPQTRASRITTAVEWIAAGKARHWKYQTR